MLSGFIPSDLMRVFLHVLFCFFPPYLDASLVHTAKMSPVKMAERVLTVWMVLSVSVTQALGVKDVRVTLTNVLGTLVGMGPFVRTHMAPITVTAATSTEGGTARMPLPISMCPLPGILDWPKE